MPSETPLLALPREVRDEIYAILLQSPIAPPPNPKEAGPRYKEQADKGTWDHREVLYPRPSTPRAASSAASLSQCNRQLCQEISALATSPALLKDTTHELDVMLKNTMLWPTWTCLPAPEELQIRHLRVNLRMFDVVQGSGLFWGDGGPGLAFVPLFRLLNRLLHHGPSFLYPGTIDRGLKIETLSIHLLFCSDNSIDRCGHLDFEKEDDPKNGKRSAGHRMRIYGIICSYMGRVVDQGLLFGKVAHLEIHHGYEVESFEIQDRKPDEKEMAEWRSWDFDWGIDEEMRVEKVDSLAYLKSL